MNAMIKAPLTGEILPPGETLCVTAVMHPFRAAATLVFVPVGSSIAEIVAVCERECTISRLSIGVEVELAGDVVSREKWSRVRPKAGVPIRVCARAGKGFGTIIRAVFSIGLLILGSVLTAGLGTVVGGLVTAGLGIVGTLALNALFPPSATKADQPKSLYSISGPQNKVAKWEPIPVVLGEVRKAAHYAADAYTEFVGKDEQFVRLLLVWGYGPLEVTDIRFGQTPITDFDDVEIQTFQGYATDGQQTLYPAQVVQDDLNLEITKKDSPFKRTSGEDATEVQFDLLAPNGIVNIQTKSGKKKTQEVKGYARLLVPGTETVVAQMPWDMSDNDTDPKRRTFRFTGLPGNAQYDMRVFRTSPDYDDNDDSDRVDNVIWTAIRTFRKAPPIQFNKPLAITALRIRATKQLSGTPDDVNALVRSLGPTYNGSTWVPNRASRNPADHMLLVLQGPANKRPRGDAQLDRPAIAGFANHCAAKGFTFDMDRDFRASVLETLKDVCAAGRGVPILRDGQWSVAWETPTAPIIQHFTPQNSWGLRRRQIFSRKPHALRVKFQNRAKEYIEDERLVFNDGFDKTNAILTEMFELPGVVDPENIHKHARYRLAELALRPCVVTLSVDAEHLRCNKGDRVWVAHDVLMNTLATGRVKGVDDQTITLSQPVPMGASGRYGIRFRLRNGASIVREVVLAPGLSTVVTLLGEGGIPGPPAPGLSAGPIFSFGPLGQEASVYRVKEIRSGEDLSAELDFVDDAPDIQTADTQPIPAYDSGLVSPVDLSLIRPKNLQLVERITGRGLTDFVADLTWSVATLAGVQGFEVRLARTGGAWTTVGRPVAPDRELTLGYLAPGAYRFGVRSVLNSGRFTGWSDDYWVTVVSSAFVPPDVESFRAAFNGSILVLSWNDDVLPIQDREIRYSPTIGATTWDRMAVLERNAQGLSLTTGARDGTYAIRSRSFGETLSASPTFLTVQGSALIGQNVVETIAETGDWLGMKSSLTVEDHGLRLQLGGNVFGLADFFSVTDFFSPGGQPVFASRGIYAVPGSIDLGGTYVSRVTSMLAVRGSTVLIDFFEIADIFAAKDFFGFDLSDWNAWIEVSTTENDPAIGSARWSDWRELTVADIQARGFRFRIVLESYDVGVTPRVAGATIIVDMPDRVLAGADLAVPAAGLRVSFAPAFKKLEGLSIASQDLASGDRAVISNKSRSGFDIVFRDAANAAVARTFDYTAKGYGQVVQ